ncbi:MAG: hypothetical protein F4X64_18775 [Chloroflexi bacterium]|nr:hypothetical protein [Chloroflexota bacterium]
MNKPARALTLIVLVAIMLVAGIAATPAQLAAPGQPTVVATANAGELQMSWNPVPGAQHYTVGYASPDEMDRMAAAGRNRLDAFYYATIGAENTSHTFTGLEPETVYWVTVGAHSQRFGATDLVWASQHAVATTAGQHGDGFCPITGLPIPEGGYLGVGDTATFGKYSITIQEVETPESVILTRSDRTKYDSEAPPGRRWLRIYMHLENAGDSKITLTRGKDSVLDTDAGNAFSWSSERTVESGETHDTSLLFDIPQDATTAVWAVRPFTSESGDNAPQLFSISIPTAEQTVVFGDLNWSSARVQTRIAQYIVEKGYGYATDARFGATLPLFQGLRGGDVHVLMELWLPNQEAAWSAGLEAGQVYSPGEGLGKDWQSAFVIPAYLQEQYPELDSVEDLKNSQYKQLFAIAETGGKARLASCPIDWRCESVNAAQIRGYGLSDHVHIVNPADGAALNADLSDAYERREPWLGYQWGTNGPTLLLDLVRLEEPAYSDECWATTMACAHEDSTILIAANHNLPGKAPDVAEMLGKWDFAVDPVYKGIVRWQDANQDADVNATAIWWLNNNADTWEQWVTDEAAASIRAALAAGEIPDGWPDQ